MSMMDIPQPPGRFERSLPVLSAASLDAYLQTVSQIPVLSAEEESELVRRMCGDRDAAAARTLVLSHLRFVVYIARGFLDYGLPFADLIQQGNVGLLRAVPRFDPSKGVRLISFSVHWIKSEIHEFVLKNWRIVKMATTRAQRKLFFGLRSRKRNLGWLSPPEAAAIAADLKVTPQEVLGMEARFAASDYELDKPQHSETSDPRELVAPDDGLGRLVQQEWTAYQKSCLKTALATLDARSLDIVSRRWLTEDKPMGLEELASIHAVSAERIRQIQNKALQQLRTALLDAHYERELDSDHQVMTAAWA
ncbi:RNA polymerase sigma factor RpoH [Hydrocarboniphaga sp.]|uniref:RNA polymerase sigma factor RpoH n=1 Tax=Hydrocarboniphaga sp. TaxID=2033016 RepID=UPI003D1099B0